MEANIRWGRWQSAILISFLVYEIGVHWGARIDQQGFVLVLAGIALGASIAVSALLRKKKGWMLFGGVVILSLAAGLATQSIWLDKEAVTTWVPDFNRLLWYGGVLLLWTISLRVLPWKRAWSILAIADFVAAIVLGIVLYRSADFAKEILYLGIFYLPVAIGTLLFLFEPEAWESILLFSFFGAMIVIVVIALAVLSEGEFLDGLDFGSGGTKRPKRTKR